MTNYHAQQLALVQFAMGGQCFIQRPVFAVDLLHLQKCQGQKHHRDVFRDPFRRTEAKILQPQPSLEVQVIHFASPAQRVERQDLVWREEAIGAQEILRMVIPRGPPRLELDDRRGQPFQMPRQGVGVLGLVAVLARMLIRSKR